MEEHHITVPRTARYHTLGGPHTAKAIWIVLHGYGHLARYFLRSFADLEQDLLIAAPEGLSRYYTDKEHTRVGATWMTREDREHEIADQIIYLDRLAEELRNRCPAGIPLRVLGFSQGVATACRWLCSGTSSAEHLVLWGGNMPPELHESLLGDKFRTMHVHLVHGEKDPLVPMETLAASEARLRAANVPHTTHRFDGAHALDKLLLQRLLRA